MPYITAGASSFTISAATLPSSVVGKTLSFNFWVVQ
jgi:hypothetical protein